MLALLGANMHIYPKCNEDNEEFLCHFSNFSWNLDRIKDQVTGSVHSDQHPKSNKRKGSCAFSQSRQLTWSCSRAVFDFVDWTHAIHSTCTWKNLWEHLIVENQNIYSYIRRQTTDFLSHGIAYSLYHLGTYNEDFFLTKIWISASAMGI